MLDVILISVFASFQSQALPPCYARSPGRCDALYQEVRAAEAARHSEAEAIEKGLASFPTITLSALGEIADAGACEKIRPLLVDVRPHVRDFAAVAAAKCGAHLGLAPLAEALAAEKDSAVRAALMTAIGFANLPEGRAILIDLYNTGQEQQAVLAGLLQSVVYERLPAAALDGLDYVKLAADLQNTDPVISRLAAYFLSRLVDVYTVIDFQALQAAFLATPDPTLKALMLRSMAYYGDDAEAYTFIASIAVTEKAHLAAEAVRVLAAYDSHDGWFEAVSGLARSTDVLISQEALAVLASKAPDQAIDLANWALEERSVWQAARGLEIIEAADLARATDIALEWLASDDPYKAFKAIGLLDKTAKGQQALEDYAATNPDSARAAEIETRGVDPEPAPRPLSSYGDAEAVLTRFVEMETTRGTIIFGFNYRAPYVAKHVTDYVDSGAMDGTVFHRVVPGFVAQWGMGDRMDRITFGTVADRLRGGAHVQGTVGLAKLGKDTGNTQFYFNLSHNIHLNDRYTVVGQIVQGFDVMLSLQEGDRILSAKLINP